MQKHIIQRINDIAARNNINVSQLAKLIGMPQNTLSRQLNGVSSLQLDTVLSICEYFNEDISWLLTGKRNYDKSENNKPIDEFEIKNLQRKLIGRMDELHNTRAELHNIKMKLIENMDNEEALADYIKSIMVS